MAVSAVVSGRALGARLSAYVDAVDPISRAGIVSQLQGRPDLAVVDEPTCAAVAVLGVDRFDAPAARSVRSLCSSGCRVVVVAATVDDWSILSVAESGASAILRRSEACGERLAEVLLSVREGRGVVGPDMVASLLTRLGELERSALAPPCINPGGLTGRETDVLRLLADGFDTSEIAAKLSYSERTVKSVIHGVTTRFNLRNRCHAVAYALRSGAI